MSLLIYILIVWGITNIISNEFIFSKIRDMINNPFLHSLVSCSTCLGFWIGMIIFILLTPIQLTGIVFIDMILCGFITSGVNNIIEYMKIRFGG